MSSDSEKHGESARGEWARGGAAGYGVAIETSSRSGSICVARGDDVLEERRFGAGARHAAELMPALAELCAIHQWRPGDISEVYVSMGPGSFTGIRIAISVARGLHLATGAKLVGVGTLDVIACNAPKEARDVMVMLDAKRGQVFCAQYRRWEAGDAEAAGQERFAMGGAGGWSRVREPRLIDPAEAVREALEGGAEALYIMGEGIDYHRAALEGCGGGRVVEVERGLWIPTARVVHLLGRELARAGRFSAAETFVPTYIRLAEAEEVWRKKRGLAI